MSDLVVVEKPAQWDRLKTMVLNSVSSPITKHVYNMALNAFMTWFRQANQNHVISAGAAEDHTRSHVERHALVHSSEDCGREEPRRRYWASRL